MKSRILFILLVIIAGCKKAPIVYNDVFTDTKISIFYHNKNYEIVLNNNGTISGDFIVFSQIRKSSWLPYDEEEDRKIVTRESTILQKWKLHEMGRSLFLYNKDSEDSPAFGGYLYFYKNKLFLISGYGKFVVDYKSSFSESMPELDMNEIFSDEDLANLQSIASTRFIKSEAGLYLRESNSESSPAISLMNQGSRFFILETDKEEQAVNNIKGHWVYGYWNGIKGWAFDAYLANSETKITPYKIADYFKCKCGQFVNFRTIIYELPDKNSRIVNSTITAESCYYCTHDKMEPGWVYIISYGLEGGFVEQEKIEERDKMDFQKVDKFKKFVYEGSSGDSVTNYHFKADGSCDLEYIGTPYNSYSESKGYQVYRYKEIYCIKGGKDNSIYSCFRFKNGIPCGLELDDNLDSREKCQSF